MARDLRECSETLDGIADFLDKMNFVRGWEHDGYADESRASRAILESLDEELVDAAVVTLTWCARLLELEEWKDVADLTGGLVRTLEEALPAMEENRRREYGEARR